MSITRTYRIWCGMRWRCECRTNSNYAWYGARGISVCQRWRESYLAFLEDMGEAPDGASIDRINNDGGYEPGNCRWATHVEQSRNRSTNAIVSAFGESKALIDWLDDYRCVVNASTLYARIERGWEPQAAISIPAAKRHQLSDDDVREIRRLVHECGLSRNRVAAMFDTTRSNVSVICSGKTRKGVSQC